MAGGGHRETFWGAGFGDPRAAVNVGRVGAWVPLCSLCFFIGWYGTRTAVAASEESAAELGTLRAAAARTGRRVGVAVAWEPLHREPAYARLIATEFSLVTPENELKWAPIEGTRGVPDDGRWKEIGLASTAAGQELRGHTLIWDEAIPAWAVGLPDHELARVQEAHLRRLVSQAKNDVRTWDVVNEAVEDGGQLSPSAYHRARGDGYIEQAFRVVHQLDPDALLAYNDYNIEAVNPKSDAVFRLFQAWRAKNVPVHALGIQAHLDGARLPDFSSIRANLRRFADLGVEIHLTEVDLQIRTVSGGFKGKLALQARALYELTRLCVNEPACRELTFWGLSDRHTWVDGARGDDAPLLFDDSLAPKPVYYSVRAALLGHPDPTCGWELAGSFDAPQGAEVWRASSGSGSRKHPAFPKVHDAFWVTARTATWQGPVLDVTNIVTNGLAMEVGGQVWVSGNSPAPLAWTLRIQDEAGERFVRLGEAQARAGEWVTIRARFRPQLKGWVQRAELYLEGPEPGRDIGLRGPHLGVDCGAPLPGTAPG